MDALAFFDTSFALVLGGLGLVCFLWALRSGELTIRMQAFTVRSTTATTTIPQAD